MCLLFNFKPEFSVLCTLNIVLIIKNILTFVIKVGIVEPVRKNCSSELPALLRDYLAVSVLPTRDVCLWPFACWKEFPLCWCCRSLYQLSLQQPCQPWLCRESHINTHTHIDPKKQSHTSCKHSRNSFNPLAITDTNYLTFRLFTTSYYNIIQFLSHLLLYTTSISMLENIPSTQPA